MPTAFLQLSNVAFSYGGVSILRDLSLQIGPGWAGVIGANGSGKTTLLRLIVGDLTPESGLIIRPPGDVHLCPQSVEDPDGHITSFAEARDHAGISLRNRLHLDLDRYLDWNQLSPGERKRWQIGAALYRAPAVLLLDEPTNHLDEDGRDLLLGMLKLYSGVGVIVSHDRSLLNALTSTTLRLVDGRVSVYRGAYDHARESWLQEAREQQTAVDRLRSDRDRLHGQLSAKRQAQAGAQTQRSGSSRMKNRRDRDATSAAAKHRAERGERGISQQVAVTRAQLDRVADALSQVRFQKDVGGDVFVDYEPSPKPVLMTLIAKELRAGSRPLLRDIHLQVTREDRVWLVGPNGSGKSTLLRALLGAAMVPASRLLYLPQELDDATARELLQRVRVLPRLERGRVLSLVATLGVEPDSLLRSLQPSPGQARKLALAYGLGTLVWGLILDEPTNHLDLPAIERLEVCLQRYPGCFVIVTHDSFLLQEAANTIWRLSDGRVQVEHTAASN